MPDRMRPLSLRRLTEAERGLAAEMFGGGIDAGRVRVLALPVWDRAFVASGSLMIWPARQAWSDFGEAPIGVQAVFVHELTHVWQAQRGVFLPLAKIKAGDRDASYAYDLMIGPEFPQLNIEQQAMVVEHAFLASRGGAAQHGPELYVQAASHWRQA